MQNEMGNSSVLLYNSWRLAQLENVSIQDSVFPQVDSVTQHYGYLESDLIICASPLRDLHEKPKNRHEVCFSHTKDSSLNCKCFGLCAWVCEAASQSCCLASGSEITGLA